jgi:hypothetical protein
VDEVLPGCSSSIQPEGPEDIKTPTAPFPWMFVIATQLLLLLLFTVSLPSFRQERSLLVVVARTTLIIFIFLLLLAPFDHRRIPPTDIW